MASTGPPLSGPSPPQHHHHLHRHFPLRIGDKSSSPSRPLKSFLRLQSLEPSSKSFPANPLDPFLAVFCDAEGQSLAACKDSLCAALSSLLGWIDLSFLHPELCRGSIDPWLTSSDGTWIGCQNVFSGFIAHVNTCHVPAFPAIHAMPVQFLCNSILNRTGAPDSDHLPQIGSSRQHRALLPSISDLLPTTTHPAVKFSWMKAINTKDVDTCACKRSSHQGQFLTLHSFEDFETDRCTVVKAPMVGLEGSSRGPAHGTVKGWKIMKAGMEKVLGRSILPARDSNLSKHLAGVCAATGANVGALTHSSTSTLDSKRSSPSSSNSSLPASEQEDLCNHEQPHKQAAESRIIKSRYLLSQDKALAGAMAGTCVSLCLHPVDTVKTVIQAQSCGHRSIIKTLVRLVSDRGFFGLYRGLGSNLAASAPISAIYTFTYESVKAALLPLLPKEYHAFVHCTAGGCASVATSIFYTPSECVKQRMQVGSLYRNSWLAFLGILKNGGLSVLYSGWGAVLWRNVPQSVIKFYTYEGLKQYVLAGRPAGSQLNTWQTLAFGGLAGSTAALCTTPFDVVKTRLQTQVAGSLLQHKGVLHMFKQIAVSEGIGGLYRGLVPRLVIYVSQGALFFASYEFFKQLLAIEVKQLTLQSVQTQGLIGLSNPAEP